jgi:pilus assembly protein CpaF
VHANSTADVPARFEALGVAAGLPREAVHSQLAAGIEVVVHVGRSAGGRRTVEQVAVIERSATGMVGCSPAVTFADGRSSRGPGWHRLAEAVG